MERMPSAAAAVSVIIRTGIFKDFSPIFAFVATYAAQPLEHTERFIGAEVTIYPVFIYAPFFVISLPLMYHSSILLPPHKLELCAHMRGDEASKFFAIRSNDS